MTGRLSLWLNAILHPKETFAAEKANANWKSALINIGLLPIVFSLLFAILIVFFAELISSSILSLLGLSNEAYAQALALIIQIGGIVLIVALPILIAILVWLDTLIYAGIVLLFSKLLGGTGTAVQQYYLMSLYYPALFVIGIILSFVPSISGFPLGGILSFAIGSYFLILMLKECHSLTTRKAVIAWLPFLAYFLFTIISQSQGINPV